MDKQKKLSINQVEHIAKLANFHLSKKELSKFQRQLSEILSYIEILNKVDTSKIKTTSQVTGLENVFKKDRVEESLTQKEALSNTKSKQNGYFKVKSIFE